MQTALTEIPYNEVALKVGRITGDAYSLSWKGCNVAVLKVDEITEAQKKLGSLSHPNIIPLLGYAIRPAGKFCLVLPPHTVSLNQMLLSPEYSFETRMCWIQDVCNGLRALHNADLLHLNLNPNTVMFNQEKQAVLVDMDCLTPEGITHTEETLSFVAPELCNEEAPSKRCDIYSFGMLFFHCAENKSERLPQKIPPKIAGLIEGCRKAKSEDRPDSMETVNTQLQVVLSSRG